MALDPGTVLGVGLAVLGTVISIVIWLASTKAARITAEESSPSAYLQKVDQEAYERARRIYEAAIDQLENELNRVNNMARDLQEQVVKLNIELLNLRAKNLGVSSGLSPSPAPDTSNPIGDSGS